MVRVPDIFTLIAQSATDPNETIVEKFYLSTYKSDSDRYAEAAGFIDKMIDAGWLVEYHEPKEIERV